MKIFLTHWEQKDAKAVSDMLQYSEISYTVDGSPG